jgi:Flp pilus assembly pilin Flp
MTPSRSTRTFKSSERGAHLVEYTVALVVIVVVCGVAFFAFGEPSEDNFDKPAGESTTTTIQVVKPHIQKMVKATYRSRTIWCPVYAVDTQIVATSCDMIRFYNENPDLVALDEKNGKKGD